ncbi:MULTISPECIES: hypothetical protein [Dehalobacter]|jgi:hypothetical protein|uniref:Uncharacterized protein n=1 Tax=Dehalobacter restrictus (strain DSM 9455 / PER-K23) TaxID=871738 RepID=A0ABN4C0N8_DEHRP|nr:MULTISPECIES: hypothetical protein [Dehalobacter]AHF11426.1 hypothetical protein DEHRE_10685 [Dehalobacter restrictus DSM 9455]MDJ0304876.1 hypothetical protein [Dehalobacter sp.]
MKQTKQMESDMLKKKTLHREFTRCGKCGEEKECWCDDIDKYDIYTRREIVYSPDSRVIEKYGLQTHKVYEHSTLADRTHFRKKGSVRAALCDGCVGEIPTASYLKHWIVAVLSAGLLVTAYIMGLMNILPWGVGLISAMVVFYIVLSVSVVRIFHESSLYLISILLALFGLTGFVFILALCKQKECRRNENETLKTKYIIGKLSEIT